MAVRGNAGTQNALRGACVPQLVAFQAASNPNALALKAGSASLLTYRELDTRANQLAHHLRSLGVGPEVLVGLCLDRSLELVVGALAILKAGGAYLPLDPSYPTEHLTSILGDAHVPMLVTGRRQVERLPRGPWKLVTLGADSQQIARLPGDPPATLSTPEHLAYVIFTSGSTGQPKGVEITHGSLRNLVLWHQQAQEVELVPRRV